MGVGIIQPLGAGVLALALGAVLLLLLRENPVDAYSALLSGAFGSEYSISGTLAKATPLMLAGLGVLVAFRAGVFNIGGEGQIYIGALGATIVALSPLKVPGPVVLLLSVLAGALLGMAWAGIAGALKAWGGVSEVVTTLLLNFIAVLIVGLLVNGVMKDPLGGGYPWSAVVPVDRQLPTLIANTQLHAGLILGLVAAVIVQVLLRHSVFGFEALAVGSAPLAASHAGMRNSLVIMTAMCISGALCGVAGTGEVLGLHHRLFETFSSGYGYLAIAVALLGRLNPMGVVLAALFSGALLNGGVAMQQSTGTPTDVVNVIQGVLVLFLIAQQPRALSTVIGVLRRLRRQRLADSSTGSRAA